MKSKTLITRVSRCIFYVLLVCVLCVGCSRKEVELKNNKQITLDSLNAEYAKYDSLYEYYNNKRSEIAILNCDMDSFCHYRTKIHELIYKRAEIRGEIIYVLNGNAH